MKMLKIAVLIILAAFIIAFIVSCKRQETVEEPEPVQEVETKQERTIDDICTDYVKTKFPGSCIITIERAFQPEPTCDACYIVTVATDLHRAYSLYLVEYKDGKWSTMQIFESRIGG